MTRDYPLAGSLTSQHARTKILLDLQSAKQKRPTHIEPVMTNKDIITLLIAGYAAVLSTLNFVLQRRDKKARLVVNIRIGMLGSSRGQISDPLLILSARNRTDKALVVTVPGFTLPTGETTLNLKPLLLCLRPTASSKKPTIFISPLNPPPRSCRQIDFISIQVLHSRSLFNS